MQLVSVFAWSFLLAALPLAGCASNGHDLVLATVGPTPFQVTADADGSLVVFSAYDQSAHLNSLPYRRVHSDYTILTADSKLLQTVHNDNGTSVEGPKEVQIPAKRYQVVARANGYGMVTVPVVICSNQTTTVHLEGGEPVGEQRTLGANGDPGARGNRGGKGTGGADSEGIVRVEAYFRTGQGRNGSD